MNFSRIMSLLGILGAFLLTSPAFAAEHKINAEARIFKPDILYVQPGDTINFTNMTSHNAVSYVTPDGAQPFGEKGKLPGGSFSITLESEGIFGFVCEPHIGFGMVGVIVVGAPTQAVKDAAMKTATETLEGPFRRLIGKIKKVEVK